MTRRTAEQQKNYRARFPSKNRESHLRRTFNMSLEEYDAQLAKQNGSCGVCKRPATQFKLNLAVDHDHHTGEVRGLLCPYCNRRVIGRYRRDSGLDLLQHAVQYLTGQYTGIFVPEGKKRTKRRKKR